MLFAGFAYGFVHNAAAQDASAWFVGDAPRLSKIVELPANVAPDSNNVDCSRADYPQPGQPYLRVTCVFASSLGSLTTDGSIVMGVTQLAPLHGPVYQSTFIPTADGTIAAVSMPAPAIGDYVGFYHHLTKAALRFNFGPASQSYYDVSSQPDTMLRDPANGELLTVGITSIAFSSNGAWMIANMPHRGLLRVDMHDLGVKLFAAPIEPSWYLGLAAPPLAISDDGRYVAANTDTQGTGNLNVYDVSTCENQLDIVQQNQVFCTGKNIWQGTKLNGLPMGQGVLSQQPDMVSPTHLRFINDETISFNARYAVEGAHYKAASFVAVAPGVQQHKLGLLGMGDSYISGQGTFVYRFGTDTAINGCHLSELAYPFILGAAAFNSYNSIACSGALTRNVASSVDAKQKLSTYTGQVKDRIQEKDRDKPSILSTFLPGYIYQQEFASNYQPEAIVLSVGGDDIGFADIVKSCVANQGGGTCYASYEDRVELVNEINHTYSKLVNTYTTLRQRSGGARLYVVGYPEVAKPSGDCAANVHLNSDEVVFASQLVGYLDLVIQRAADTAGVFYVDTQNAFSGHRLCESGAKAMNGLTAGNDAGVTIHGKTIGIGTESYHPTVLGYQLLATVIARQTSNLMVSMPTPVPFDAPVLDGSTRLLQDVPHTGRVVSLVTHNDSIAADVMFRGDAQPVAVDGAATQLRPHSTYRVVLHSDPILLDEGGVDADGNIQTTVHVPADVPAGYHVLHVYGTDMAGESVDIQKTLYIAASADDYDGDGTPNTANSCAVVPLSGQDADQDGTDDACDPEITAAPDTYAPVLVRSDETSPDATTHPISTTAPTADAQGVSSPVAAVLGDATIDNDKPITGNFAGVTSRPSIQDLFRVNWVIVLEVGAAWSLGTAAIYYAVRRP